MSELLRSVVEGDCPACDYQCSARSPDAAFAAAREHGQYAHPEVAGTLSWPINELEFWRRTPAAEGRE